MKKSAKPLTQYELFNVEHKRKTAIHNLKHEVSHILLMFRSFFF